MDHPTPRRWISQLISCLLVGVLAIYFLTFYDVDLNLADEGWYPAQALSLEQVEISADTFERLLQRKLGIVHFTLHQLTGAPDVRSSRLLWVALRLMLALMMYAVARRLLPRGWAAIVASLVVIAAGPWHKSWYPFVLGLMLFLASIPAPWQKWRILVAGVMGGVVTALNPVGIPVGVTLPLFAWLISEPFFFRTPADSTSEALKSSLKIALTLSLSALLGLFLLNVVCGTLLVLLRDAAPALLLKTPAITLRFLAPEILAWRFNFAKSWSQTGHLPMNTLFLHQDPTLVRWMIGWIPGVTFFMGPIALLITAFIAWSAKQRGDHSHARLLMVLVVLGAANFIKASARTDLFHITQGGGPVYLLMFFLMHKGGRWLREKWTELASRVRVTLAVGLMLLVAIFPLGYGAAVLLSPGQWAASIGSLALAEQRLQLDRASLRLPRERAALLERMVDQVQRWTAPEDPIFVMPFCPMLYFLTERRCAVDDHVFTLGLLAVLPGLGLIPGVTDLHLAEQLEVQRVNVVITCPNIDPRLDYEAGLPRTRELLARDYHLAASDQGFKLFLRRDHPDREP